MDMDMDMDGSAVDVYVHSNRRWLPPPPLSYRAHAFWAGDLQNLTSLRNEWDCCWRHPSNVDSVFKYRELLEVSRQHRRRKWLGVLADSDVLFQCTAEEFRSQFAKFNSPLVIGGERKWYPIPRRAIDPFGPPAHLSWKRRYTLRHSRQYYPNSGLIVGTSAGMEALAGAIEQNPRFPCCALEGDTAGYQLDSCASCRPYRHFPKPVSCVVEDQACMQVALASRRHAPQHVVDINSSLILNLHMLAPSDLARSSDGRIAFRHTGKVPCVLHSNGFKSVIASLEKQYGPDTFTWAVSPEMRRSHLNPRDELPVFKRAGALLLPTASPRRAKEGRPKALAAARSL